MHCLTRSQVLLFILLKLTKMRNGFLPGKVAFLLTILLSDLSLCACLLVASRGFHVMSNGSCQAGRAATVSGLRRSRLHADINIIFNGGGQETWTDSESGREANSCCSGVGSGAAASRSYTTSRDPPNGSIYCRIQVSAHNDTVGDHQRQHSWYNSQPSLKCMLFL